MVITPRVPAVFFKGISAYGWNRNQCKIAAECAVGENKHCVYFIYVWTKRLTLKERIAYG